MVGGRFRCLSCSLYSLHIGLLLGVCFHNAEASGGNRVISKNVGDSVELSPNVSTEWITDATWKYKNSTIALKDTGITKDNHFQGRVEFNNITLSLTLRKLTLQDSGDFLFQSEVKDAQRPTVTITLQVHEAIRTKPILTHKILPSAVNGSCDVFLECTGPSDISVNYSWAVGNHTHRLPSLQHTIRPEDGATTFTCTVSNAVSHMSESTTVMCSNQPSDKSMFRKVILEDKQFVGILAAAGGLLILLIIIVTTSVCLCKRRRAGSDSNELTVYADISEYAVEQGTSDNLKPCSLYDVIQNRTQAAVPQGHLTVYDKIQLNRMRVTSVSQYQEVS
ncbi:signaling lymphocytic activation molecule [Nematolebias whitei]|uniref:signaling lymphocytic activation molecule n=1 Tax=Nematolebias whitei TaxID=451745 RepID=UPI001897A349|nr:signaling lymphocytic activation molecule [Nematolebias whitei]